MADTVRNLRPFQVGHHGGFRCFIGETNEMLREVPAMTIECSHGNIADCFVRVLLQLTKEEKIVVGCPNSKRRLVLVPPIHKGEEERASLFIWPLSLGVRGN